MNITIIGVGNLGTAIAKGLIRNNAFSALTLTKRNLSNLKAFEGLNNVFLSTDNSKAVQTADVVIFAVQPAQFENIALILADSLNPQKTIISTITGLSIAKIKALIGNDKQIVRAMPNTAIAVQKSMTCLASDAYDNNHLKTAQTIFNQLGQSLVIPEAQMQAATVVCASGIAFWMRLIRATTQAAIQLGFDSKEAQQLAMYTGEGAAKLLIESGNHPEEEIDNVTTPQGCTIEGLNEMEHQGLSSSLIQGMVASFNKINTIKSNIS